VQAVEVVDGALIVVGDHSGTARLALLRDGALVREADLMRTDVSRASIAIDGATALVCISGRAGPIYCRSVRLSDGMFTAPPLPVVTNVGDSWEVRRAGCGFQVVRGEQVAQNSGTVFTAYEITTTGDVISQTIDRRWVQSSGTFALFESDHGALIRLALAPTAIRESDVVISTLACGPELPQPSCDDIPARMCELACGETCGLDVDECAFGDGAVSSGTSRSDCLVALSRRTDCATIDLGACGRALQEPAVCRGTGSSAAWEIPADCVLPR
jgi:hypothetical protein